HALGILADDGEVDVVGRGVLQRTERNIEQAHGTHVGIEVHPEAHAQQDFLGVDVARHARIAERADEDGVEVASQHLEAVGRNGAAVGEVSLSAPVELGEFNRRAGSANNFDDVGNNFLADAISRNDCNALVGGHKEKIAEVQVAAVIASPEILRAYGMQSRRSAVYGSATMSASREEVSNHGDRPGF